MKNPFILKKTLPRAERRTLRGEYESALEFEESVLDRDSSEALERIADSRQRILILWILPVLVFVILFSRLYYLALAQHEYYREIADGNRLRIEYLVAPRGAVYDMYDEVVASNRPSFEFVVNPLDLPEEESELHRVISRVAEILEMPKEEIEDIITNESVAVFQSVLVRQNIPREQALILHEQADTLTGFRVVNAPIRDYSDPSKAFAHLLGYVGKITAEEYEILAPLGYLYNDAAGKTGLEWQYEGVLRGQFGQRQVEVDARGVVKQVFGEKDSVPGANLILNLDAGLQKKLFDLLTERLRAIGKRKAVAIAMDPRNGAMRAFVSLPAYDNNEFAEGIKSAAYTQLAGDPDRPLFNRAIGGSYPPGSTIKPVVAAAALAEGVVTEQTVINDTGSIVVRNQFGGPDYYFYGYDRSGLGRVDVRSAIAKSSDIFFYIVGGGYEPVGISGLGVNKLAEYYQRFKLGGKLGIDLPGEVAGLVPTPEWKEQHYEGDPVSQQWFLGNTYHMSIGQGDVLVTPLQVLSWTATVANGGSVFRPQIASRIESQAGEIMENFEPEFLGSVEINPEYMQIVKEGMHEVVTEGTAKSLGLLPITSGGKTGTAQFDARNLFRTHAWFTAFAPYENPEIAITVLIEDGGEGGANAVPVVREALRWWAEERYGK